MAKVNKVYPSFYNGVSQQASELILDTNCRRMVNCIPSVITGLSKRPPAIFRTEIPASSTVFHSYDRGEDEEEYIFIQGLTVEEPIIIIDKQGNKMVVEYDSEDIKEYLFNGNLKGLTVQDRTWIVNKNTKITVDTSVTPLQTNYDRIGYYWLSRSSSDVNNKYNYAIYLNNVVYEASSDKSDTAASALVTKINASGTFTATVLGSIIKIVTKSGADFKLSSWDSWGSQASFSWKGSVNKLTDLPEQMPFDDVYVGITGNDTNEFTDYFVKWNGSSWEETRHPNEVRGKLQNMPIALDRTALSNGIATFTATMLDWDTPKVGSLETNSEPTFVDKTVQDLIFYKNRFGICTAENLILSRIADYNNFYIQTVLDVLDSDPIDIAIDSNKASKLYYAQPFNSSLYLFTKDGQFELSSEGFLSPTTVTIENATNYPMSEKVVPQVINNSLYFISKTGNAQQLREYIKDETLTVKGIDLNVATPTYLDEEIVNIFVNSVLGIILCTTKSNKIYVFNFLDTGTERVQNSWHEWLLLDDTYTNFEYVLLDTDLVIFCYKDNIRYMFNLDLKDKTSNRVDVTNVGNILYNSEILLPNFYPHLVKLGTPKDKILLKKVIISGEGNFSANLYRKDYNYNYIKEHTDVMMYDLDFHIASRVDNVDISIYDNTEKDFTINSIVVEGLLNVKSREIQ